MRPILAALLLSAAGATAAAPAAAEAASEDCGFPQRQPVQVEGRTQTLFVNACGQRYEAGYRLEGNTLHFPRGGTHTLPDLTEAEAEQTLRRTYGLVGEREALVRTAW
jgi:hypothetical protein